MGRLTWIKVKDHRLHCTINILNCLVREYVLVKRTASGREVGLSQMENLILSISYTKQKILPFKKKILNNAPYANRNASFNFLTVMKNLDQCSYKKEWITFSFHSRKCNKIIVKERGNQRAWDQNMVSKYDRSIKQLMNLLFYLEGWCSHMLKSEMCLKWFFTHYEKYSSSCIFNFI